MLSHYIFPYQVILRLLYRLDIGYLCMYLLATGFRHYFPAAPFSGQLFGRAFDYFADIAALHRHFCHAWYRADDTRLSNRVGAVP